MPASWAQKGTPKAPIDEVNVFIGSGGTLYSAGMTFPAAAVPFGMVRVGPDGKFSGPLFFLNQANIATAGYAPIQRKVYGFSHTRLQGAGLKEGGAFRVLPVLFKDGKSPDDRLRKKGLRFKKKTESASPGYYAVRLKNKITAEMTSTGNCSIQRYSIPKGTTENFALSIDATANLSSPDKKSSDSQISTQASGQIIQGYTLFKGDFSNRYDGTPYHFYAKLSRVPTEVIEQGDKLWLVWKDHPEEVLLKSCLSAVSQANAELNFSAEVAQTDLESAVKSARSQWSLWLDRAKIQSSSPSVRIRYYSALYRAGLMPTRFQDSNGEYMGFGRVAGTAQGFTYYTDLSLWDSFRTLHPLYNLIAPEVQLSVLKSLLTMARSFGNVFPIWPAGSGEGGSMFGFPAHFLFAESWAKKLPGLTQADAQEALTFMKNAALHPGALCGGSLGYCASDVESKSVSKTLEVSWANGVSAAFAQSLGDTQAATEFEAASLGFEKIWNPKNQLFTPRDSTGKFLKIAPKLTSFIDFLGINDHAYAEGTPHQWRYSIPHRADRLIELMGGPKKFEKELCAFMGGASRNRSAISPGWGYWLGNEHDFHALYLFNDVNRPELTQYWARWALETRFGDSVDGLDGNDDSGSTSAWYLLSALGIYPQPGTENYWIGSPVVESADLNLGQGHSLKVRVQNQGVKNVYVQKASLNGKAICKPFIRHSDLVDGELRFEMGPTPAQSGGFSCP
ncbi:MAG: GH92 family glycosyl hydrolase [Bdellovibrionales bacterium]|nr:GH92 family glycosyl hydrolase [Bdellovibrionales bacterium]